MFSTAVTQSSPAFFTFLYSTRNDWMGKPRLPRGIQVTYADVSVAAETVGLSGASGAAVEGEGEGDSVNWERTRNTQRGSAAKQPKNYVLQHLLRAHPSETEERRNVSRKMVRTVRKRLVFMIS